MRHNKSINHLGRQSGHRKALLSNLATSLILQKRITTTTAKAKALKTYIEPLITKSKEDTTHSRRIVFSYLKNKEAVTELFRTVAPKIADRPGGYTRVLKLGFRAGDAADMALIELVDFNEAALASAKKETKKTTRRGGAKRLKLLPQQKPRRRSSSLRRLNKKQTDKGEVRPSPCCFYSLKTKNLHYESPILCRSRRFFDRASFRVHLLSSDEEGG